ncbi:PTS transporter subunit EIIC [Lacticaseibacillus brantae]|uniref:Permease IIC component n=1 Tax=Lacticaseibacillus brantae DSM 23927 TaxID=1423727 RepID=A0A0R2AY08_9LACO|nr:PTS transporter subunit EIIC [Lacticaseibacillus brantae]KRM71362.1 cellobiose-specific PTS system IIC [Lacticaseibacillus brantae DSM 23927]
METYLQTKLLPGIIRQSVRIRRWRMYRVLKQTLAVIFPFILLGVIAEALNSTVFSPRGFFAEIYHLQTVIPFYTQIQHILSVLQAVTINLSAPAVAFLAAKFMAHSYHKDETLAGLTSALSFFTFNLNFSPGQHDTFLIQNLGYRGLFFAFWLGVGIGWLFRFGKISQEPALKESSISDRVTNSLHHLLLINLILIISMAISYAISLIAADGIIGVIYSFFQFPGTRLTGHVSIRLALLTTMNALIWWAGLEGPLNLAAAATQGNGTLGADNLNYALEHNNLFNVPHPYTMSTIYYPFANFGGVGMMMALIFAIFIVSRRHSMREIAGLGLAPAIVNNPVAILVGLPVILNPLLLIPFILTPLVNQGIAWFVIRLHIMPPPVYTVPTGTPGPFIAFLGTNGNWVALVVSLLCLLVSTLIYIPFVRLTMIVNDEAAQLEAQDEKALA